MSNPKKTRVDEDDDFDELDDVLQQFNQAPKVPPPKAQPQTHTAPAPTSSSSTLNRAPPPPTVDPLAGMTGDFERELMRGMEDLVRDIASEAGLDEDMVKKLQQASAEGELSEEDKEKEQVFKAAWEAMLLDGMNGAMKPEELIESRGSAASGRGQAGAAGAQTDTFQAGIRATMDKLNQSDTNLQADAASPDDMSELLKHLNMGDGDMDSEEAVQKALERMMAQLMSKDILYEPLKELYEKFPEYLKDNVSKLSIEDKTRYDKQYAVVTKIVAEFEDPAYSDEDQKKGEKIVGLMNEMQDYGSPPTEIMGPLPPGLELGTDGLPNLPGEGCSIA